MNIALYGKVDGIWVELPGGLPDPNICHTIGVKCPMKSGTEYTVYFNVFVDPKFPSVSKNKNEWRLLLKMWLL